MCKLIVAGASAIGAFLLGSAAPPSQRVTRPFAMLLYHSPVQLMPESKPTMDLAFYSAPYSLKLPGVLSPPAPPTPNEALRDGVLVVVSLASQRAFVFRKGKAWASTEVSTGRHGKETPQGVFPILEKKALHHSTLYDDAPMPFMQRLTWGGVALHAGNVPGYPASHGCIRLPTAFAQKLYGITNFSSTIVVVTDRQLDSPQEARRLA